MQLCIYFLLVSSDLMAFHPVSSSLCEWAWISKRTPALSPLNVNGVQQTCFLEDSALLPSCVWNGLPALWQQQGASWTPPARHQLLWPTSRSLRPPESWLTLSLVERGATATTGIRIDAGPSEMHTEGGSCRALNRRTLVHWKKRLTAKLLSLWGKGCLPVTLWTCCSEESLFSAPSSMEAPSVQQRGPALHQHRRLSAPLLSPSPNTDLVRTSTLNFVFLN